LIFCKNTVRTILAWLKIHRALQIEIALKSEIGV